jgi:rare lipoprotein A (peptidoglycan hydrolase)
MRGHLTVAVLAATLPISKSSAHEQHHKTHHKGCNTHACDKRIDRQWARTHRPMKSAMASWYAQSGITACGHWGSYSVAHKTLPCDARVRICHKGCVTATVVDRGPFIAGREFDLTPSVKNTIGCSDLCTIRYRVK